MTCSKIIMYGAGQLYFMSTDVAHYVGHTLTAEDRKNMSHDRKTEDADMGVFVFSNPRPIKFMNLALNQWWIHHETKQWINSGERGRDEGVASTRARTCLGSLLQVLDRVYLTVKPLAV